MSYRGLYGVAGNGVEDVDVVEPMLASAKKLGGKLLKIEEYVRRGNDRVMDVGRTERIGSIDL